MAKRKKTQLPKDFETQLKRRGVATLKKLFDTVDVNARGGYRKQTALAFSECPDELARWLVEQGADLNAADRYGDTPLHERASRWNGRIEVLLELGADVNQGEGSMHGTPLHTAAGGYQVAAARLLLKHGARVNAVNKSMETPLLDALQGCSNINIEDMAALAELLLEAGAKRTPEMKEAVTRIGTDFEFHRAGFVRDVDTTSTALDKLYALFKVPPVPHRQMHDGKSPIVARSKGDQHQELWELLVPSSGACATVQGEVIRISGRIHSEIYRNGGANWDRMFRMMGDAFLVHVASGKPLAEPLLSEARDIVKKRKHGDTSRLCDLAVQWVALNPKPVKLARPEYDR